MSRTTIPVVIVQANAVDDGDPIELSALGVDADAANDHSLLNPTGKVALLCILDPSTPAQGTLALPTQPTAGDTMTIGVGTGVKVYTFRATADFDADGEVEIDAGGVSGTRQNIVDAINGDDGVNTAHSQVTAALGSGNAIVFTAIEYGTLGNQIATTETFTAGGNVFDAATLGTTTAGGTAPSIDLTVAGVDDPYGRGASPDGDLTITLDTPGAFLLGRFSPAMFNQSGGDARKVYVNAASVTAPTAIHLVALSL